MPEVSPLRLNLLRAIYLLMFVGQGTIQWPLIMSHTNGVSFWHGVGSSMLGAMALVAGLGIRYPLKMLPLLFFEMAWKATWLISFALPLWLAHRMDGDTAESVKACLMGVIIPVIMPWSYVWAKFLRERGDPWSKRAQVS